MDNISSELLNEFSFFKTDLSYYEKIVASFSMNESTMKNARIRIIKDMNDSLIEDSNWLISYVTNNINSLNSFCSFLKKYRLNPDLATYQSIFNGKKSILIDIERLIDKSKKYTEEKIKEIASDNTLFNILYSYVVTFDLLDLEIESANDLIKEVGNLNKSFTEDEYYDKEETNSSYFGLDDVKIYLQEAGAASDFSKNHEYFTKYNEYKSMLEVETDPDKRKKIEYNIDKYYKLIAEINLLLVVNIAKKYIGRGIPFLDLIGYGNEGLLKAIDKYDITRGTQFSTYATWWINQSIQMSIADYERSIRIPVNKVDFYTKVYKANIYLQNTLGREPTFEELANYLGVSVKKVEDAIINNTQISSLDAPITGEDDADELGYFIADNNSDFVDKYINETSNKEFVEKITSYLTTRQEFVLRMRFGVSDGKNPLFDRTHTLEETGKAMHLTRERVRQIEAKAIKRIRKKENIKVKEEKPKFKFWDYFEEYSKDAVLEKMKYLSSEDKELLYERFGKDLNTLNNIEKSKRQRARLIIDRILKMLQNPNYKPVYKDKKGGLVVSYYINPLTGEKEKIRNSYFPYENMTLVMIYGSETDDIKEKIKLRKDANLFYLVFEKTLEGPANITGLSKEEIKSVKKTLNAYKRNAGKNNNKRLDEYLKCTHDDVLKYTSKLDEEDVFILHLLFGDMLLDIADFSKLTPEQRAHYSSIFLKLKKMRNDNKLSFKLPYNGKPLYEVIGCSKDLWEYVKSGMRSDSNAATAILKYENKKPLTKQEYNFVSIKVQKTRANLNKIKERYEHKSINYKRKDSFEYENLDLGEVLNTSVHAAAFFANKRTNDNSKVRNLLMKVFASDFMGKANTNELEPYELSRLNQILKYLIYEYRKEQTKTIPKKNNKTTLREVNEMEEVENKNRGYTSKARNGAVLTYVINPETGKKELVSKSDFPYEGKTLEEIIGKENIGRIKSNDILLYKKVFGTNLDKKANTLNISAGDLKTIKSKIKKILKTTGISNNVYVEDTRVSNVVETSITENVAVSQPIASDTLVELPADVTTNNQSYIERLCKYFECSEEEMNMAISHLRKKSRAYEIVTELFFDDNLNKNDKSTRFQVLYRIRRYILQGRQKNNDTVDEPAMKLSVVDKVVLEEETQVQPSNKTISEEPVEILTPTLYEGLSSSLNTPFFKELIKLFPLEYRHVTELKLGIYDGIMYSDEVIASLYNTTVDDIHLRFSKGKLLFDKIMEEYKNTFNKEFPIQENVNNYGLKREKE